VWNPDVRFWTNRLWRLLKRGASGAEDSRCAPESKKTGQGCE
jgi:hypothetical protein